MTAPVSLAELRLTRALAASNHAEGLTTIVMSEKLARVCDWLIELHALASQYASECGECSGRGTFATHREDPGGHSVLECWECEDIRAVIAKAAP